MIKGLTRAGALLVAVFLLIGAGMGVWFTLQPSAEASEDRAGLMMWPETQRSIRTLEQDVRRGEAGAATYTKLGYTYVQAARKTGDGAYGDEAEDAFAEVLERKPESFKALNGMGMIAVRRHQFGKGVKWAKRSLKANPRRSRTYGILIDAYIELGRYDEAVETGQNMVDMRPDLASYSRVSYLRELMGDLDGAIDAMKRAVSASSGSPEHTTWTRVYLGHLYYKQGNLAEAEKHYQIALQHLPQYGHALAGLARVRLAQDRFDEAVALYERAVEAFPIAEYVIALEKAYEAAGQPEKANEQYERAVEILKAERARGMDNVEELALLLLEREQKMDRALSLAKGAHERRPTVKNADILAWAQYKTGHAQKAYQTAQKALRLDTKEPRYYYHAGMIAARTGRREEARKRFQQALDINSYSPFAEKARKQRAALEQVAAQ